MRHRVTHLLVPLVVAGALACVWSYWRSDARRASAEEARANLLDSQRALAEISQANGGGGGARTSTASLDVSEMNRRLRDAAAAAGIAEKLTSIEPSQPNRIPGSDYQEMAVFLKLEPLPLRQLVTFLHELGTSDRSSRAKSIELGTPPGTEPGDMWTADVTIAYLTYSPSEEKSP